MSTCRISLVDLDAWEAEFVTATLEIAAGTDIGAWRRVAPGDAPDALLVGARADARPPVLHKAAGDVAEPASPRAPVIVVCGDASLRAQCRDAVFLERPVTYPHLIAALREVESRLRSVTAAVAGRAAAVAVATRAIVPAPAPAPAAPGVIVAPAPAPAPAPAAEIAPAPAAAAAAPAAPSTLSVPAAAPVPAPASLSAAAPAPAARGAVPAPRVVVPGARHAGSTSRGDAASSLTSALARRIRPSRRFRENTRLLGLLQDASLRRGITEITHPGFPSLTIIPAEHAYACEVDPAGIASLFRTPAWSFNERELDPVVAARALARVPREPLWRLLYCAALFGSEGRLLADVGPDDQLRLIAAPDFSAVPHDAAHRAVAGHLSAQVDTLVGTARATGVSLESVIGFCNACEQVGLVERNGAQGRGMLAYPERPRRRASPPHALAPTLASRSRGEGGLLRVLSQLRGFFR